MRSSLCIPAIEHRAFVYSLAWISWTEQQVIIVHLQSRKLLSIGNQYPWSHFNQLWNEVAFISEASWPQKSPCNLNMRKRWTISERVKASTKEKAERQWDNRIVILEINSWALFPLSYKNQKQILHQKAPPKPPKERANLQQLPIFLQLSDTHLKQ